MPLKSVSSFLRSKCSIAAHTSVMDKRTRLLLQVNKDEISNEAIEGLKLALFHTALLSKAALIPVPTPPPCTPCKSFEPMSKPEEYHTGFPSSNCRPTSTQSLPPVDIIRSPLKFLLRSLPPSPPSPLSTCSSDIEAEHAMFDLSEKSTDEDVRSSPCPYSSTESLAEEQNNLHSSLLLSHSLDSTRLNSRAWTSAVNERRASSPRLPTRGQSSCDPEERKGRSNSRRGPLCTECGAYVPFTIKDEPLKPGIKKENAPIYHILERPEMCDACFKQDQRRRSSDITIPSPSPSFSRKDSPPLPPLPTLPSSMMLTCSKDATYETVLQPGQGGTDEKGSPRSRRKSFSLNLVNSTGHSSSDYESISPFSSEFAEKTKDSCQLKKGATCPSNSSCGCHDYESIKLVGYVNKGGIDHKSSDTKGMEYLHNYADIPNTEQVEEADTPGILAQSPFYRSVNAARNQLMKIDSQGYASVLPTSKASYELDCHYQDGYRGGNSDRPLSSSYTNKVVVSNVEEVWQHQQERGYAALTLKSRPPCPPPPLISRTSSDGLLSTSFSRHHPGVTAQDYEVPIPLHSLQPPLSITNRKNSIPQARKRAVSSPSMEQRYLEGDRKHLSSVSEHDRVDAEELVEHDEVHATVLSRHIDLSPRKHSASDVTEVTTQASRLPRRSQ